MYSVGHFGCLVLTDTVNHKLDRSTSDVNINWQSHQFENHTFGLQIAQFVQIWHAMVTMSPVYR